MSTEHDPVNLKAAQAAREETDRQAKGRREQEISDFKWLMKDERGRRFVWRLMREGRVFHSTFDADAAVMSRNEGKREQGLALVNEVLELCPEAWLEMINDQKRR